MGRELAGKSFRPSESGRNTKANRKKLHLEALEDRVLMNAGPLHLDLGSLTTPAASGYTEVPVTVYDATKGFGWESTSGLSAYDAGTGQALTRDGHMGSSGAFRVALDNGTYWVTATVGDPNTPRDQLSISAE